LYLQYLNTPAFLDSNFPKKSIDAFEKFLLNIFDQDISVAKRRNMVFHGAYYQRVARDSQIYIRLYKKIYAFAGRMYYFYRKFKSKLK